ncbi:LysR substrate-binding domain-containing protein [Vibrio mangrovi]|uniref:Glycine cleavage system transcriptional activator n=1 Tax=Vibrio mangrovi TaxID=474394 RepID=A0A1Y6ISU9_9VIBR|nr:LysR substrate-binding domain-containing protein [Vibrio mangrovi]MDW6003626.1 LysR substrate-binding domain-containing protein [Vibrio mangrovi]SMR99582.1 Glycine cleavage system transcriptional activator [Vibrio mangrovi]
MDRKQLLLTNMHTFSIAAKFLSFTRAAEELCISQGAVSQRIKGLEQQLGFSLFIRLTRKLELTEEGERLLHALNQSFDLIFSEVEDIRFNELRGELYIGVAPTFAQTWLLPRLPSFQQLYPSLNLKIRVKGSRLNFQHEPVDLAIYYSDGHHPGFHCQPLYEEYLTPVCSPDYYQQLHAHGPDGNDLSRATFIHSSESLEFDEPQSEWQHWMRQQSNPEWRELDVMQNHCIINHSNMATIAAKSGMGFAMARLSLVENELSAGELIAPFEQIRAEYGYDLICPHGQENRPRIKAFIEWIARETTCWKRPG